MEQKKRNISSKTSIEKFCFHYAKYQTQSLCLMKGRSMKKIYFLLDYLYMYVC